MNEPVILLIETSTASCSAAIARGEKIIASRCEMGGRMHASMLAPFIRDILAEAGLAAADCSAVAVSGGPGSYTGLRVGVSTAKGLCFGASLPLIAVNTLQILAVQGAGEADFIIPMIDARRMEVYSAVFDGKGHPLTPTEAVILDSGSFSDYLERGSVLFIGDGAEKFSGVCGAASASFRQCNPQAKAMAAPALAAWKNGDFCDTAYYEPFYLKEFVAGISKKSVL